VLTFMSKGFANMVIHMAFDTTVLSSSGKSVRTRSLPMRANPGQRGAVAR
jgi:hypothetical protein